MNRVEIYRDGVKEEERELLAYMSVGRVPGNDIQLESTMISRKHAEIVRLDDGSFQVKDAGSTNGTYVNGKRIPEEGLNLRSGDRITLGNHVVRFVLEDSQVVSNARPSRYQGPPPSSPLMEHLLAEHERIPIWCSEHKKMDTQLRVADIIDETPDVKTIRFVGTDPTMFSYEPGQFITLIIDIGDEKDVKRSYSMSSTPSRPHTLEITVKRVEGGLMSNYLLDQLKLGQIVRARGPSGKFTCFKYPSEKMLFVGAGSGCTPLMAMTRWIIDTTADVDVKFLISARTPQDILFSRELEFLSSRHNGFCCAATITGFVSGREAWMGYRGRISPEMIKLFCPDFRDRHVFLCGPNAFMDAVKENLRSLGFDMKNFHSESFGGKRVAKGTEVAPRDAAKPVDTSPQARAAQKAEVAATLEETGIDPGAIESAVKQTTFGPQPDAVEEAPKPEYQVTFKPSGVVVPTDGECSVLDVAEANGLEIEYSCREGSCEQCLVKCKGPVDEEVECDEDGHVYACTAYARGDIEIEILE